MIDFEPDKTILVTGVAGFVGYHLSKRLLEAGFKVIGIDNMNDYYDPSLKRARLDNLIGFKHFQFVKGDFSKKEFLMEIMDNAKPEIVIHLGAQAGVRYSLENPDAYLESNVIGFYNLLEACRKFKPSHLLFASSSSVYGNQKNGPFEEMESTDEPVSFYAATKKTNEIMARTYSYLYRLPITGMRIFTAYGPYGRPDMSYFLFANNYFAGEPITLFNDGKIEEDLYRDFTYIDDLVEAIVRLMDAPSRDAIPFQIFNIGNSNPVRLMDFVAALEKAFSHSLEREVVFKKNFEPIKLGDVSKTFSSSKALFEKIGFQPSTPIEVGLQKFAEWYVDYYSLRKKKNHD